MLEIAEITEEKTEDCEDCEKCIHIEKCPLKNLTEEELTKLGELLDIVRKTYQ